MKLEKVQELVEQIEKADLNPNEYVVLYYLFCGKPIPKTINGDAYIYSLKMKGWITSAGKLSGGAMLLFNEDKISADYIERYRLLWPSIILPSGKSARSSNKELEIRFKWFFENFSYTWEEVYKATEEYIKYFQERGYNFMRTSAYFVYKEVSPKLRNSTLAEWCDNISNDNSVIHDDGFDINV
jgi:hypothetical protein